MQTLFLVAAGVVLGVLVLGAIAFVWIKKKLGGVCESLMQIVQASGLPPFRIHLDAQKGAEWNHPEKLEQATAHIETVGYVRIGDYDVREMDDVLIRAFSHPETGFFFVLYDHDQAGVFADAFRDFSDGTSITISTAPETGMARPTHAPLFRLEADVCEEETAQQLHDQLAHEAIGRETDPTRPEEFAHMYSEFYAQEMDWRIARGGVTRLEIERVAEVSGQPAPSDAQVEMIQGIWSCAIGSFIDEEVERIWLAESNLGAVEWESMRDRIKVVHEHAKAEELAEDLAWSIVDAQTNGEDDFETEAAHNAAVEKLEAAFESRSIRDGFEQAMNEMPEKSRYRRVGSVEDPWPADVWVAPEEPDF